MNYKLFIILFIFAQCFTLILAQEKSNDLSIIRKKANEAYSAKNYKEASTYFVELASHTNTANDYFNAACAHSLAENTEEAFKFLEKALDAGYSNYSNMSRDADLTNLRSDNRFSILLQRLKKYDRITESTMNPDEAKIVYEDVINFSNAFKMIHSTSDTVEILQKYYIDKGTPGLKIFIGKYGLTAELLADRIKKYPKDYSSVEVKLKWLQSIEPIIRSYFTKFKTFIPNAIYPPTYYLVGKRYGTNSGSIEGQLITVEKRAVDTVDVGLEGTIIHELTHLNQLHAIGSLDKYLAIYNDEKSLLAICIREGVANFFAELVTGEGKTEQRSYLVKHEMEIWRRFEADMYRRNTKDWVFANPVYQGQPRDLGYVMGEKIVEYYYKHSLDLKEAVDVILSITEYKEFLEKSQYRNKFIHRK
jgi:tetratricopeptide (TPR) repeat protein